MDSGVVRALRRMALVAAGVAAGLLVVECGLRWTYSAEDFGRRFAPPPGPRARVAHPFLPYAGAPGLEYSLLLDIAGRPAPVSVRHNGYGLRSHELPASKSSRDYFVIALGGSTTWGVTAESNRATWPELLEAMLAREYPRRNIRVFNFGSEGATTAYNVVTLALVGIHIDPDLVIVYHGFNDYGSILAADYRTDHSHHFRDVDPSTASRGLRETLPSWLAASYAVTFGAGLLDRIFRINDLRAAAELPHPISEPDVELAARRIVPHLETLHSVATGAGAGVLFSTFQLREGGQPGYETLNRTLRRFYQEAGLPYVDQDALMPDGDEALQFDDCHFTARGRELLARNFFDAIVEHGFVEATFHGDF